MGKITESLFPLAHNLETTTILVPIPGPDNDNSLFNLMETYEEDTTAVPDACRLHIPTWLNLWCISISICVLMLLVILGVLVRYIQMQKQRIIRSEIVHVSPDFYQEHYLDRSRIMVY